MPDLVVYDKFSWHFPEGKGCPGPQAARAHFETVMDWLQGHGLLTPFGREVSEMGVSADFALTSDMVTERGNRVLTAAYGEWLNTVDYDRKPDTSLLDSALAVVG